MKKFMAVYTGTAAGRERWNQKSEAERQAAEKKGIQAWHDWMTRHAAAVVDAGGPLGKTKRASLEGVSDTSNALAGYVVVQAESHEAAARMFEGHPHFAIFPGDAVEIMECLPIPGQA
jgi:hypothetical protein